MKAAVRQVREEYAFSQRRACGLMTVAVSSYRYQTDLPPNSVTCRNCFPSHEGWELAV
jgi:hypothetical protein